MLEVKLPYYPQQTATLSESPFGVPELSCPKIYENPLNNKVILRIDVLESLRDLLGDNCLYYRDHLYKLVSGNVPDFNKMLNSYYSKFPHFREYMNEEFYFGDTSRPISDRTLEHMNSLILQFETKVRSLCELAGGKYLVYTHYFLYYAYASKELVPQIDGGFVIC